MRTAYALICGTLILVASATLAWAQDDQNQTKAADPNPQDQPAATQPAAEQPENPQASDETKDEAQAGGEASQKFDGLYGDWKAILKQLRELKVRYQTATQEQRAEIQQQYDEEVAKGRELLPQLIDAGVAAFREAPNADLQLARFLISAADDYRKHDRYEAARDLGRQLIDAKCDDMRIYEIAGVAAFSLHDFDLAKQYLTEAQTAGASTPDSSGMLSEVDEYKKFWEEEQKIREAEEAAEGEKQLPRVKLQTNKGDVEIELFEDQAPETVGNFISLVEKGFYDDKTFHRVLPEFMAQGGDPSGDGSGGPGYKIYDELGDNARKHFRGSLSMANSGPDSGGSQFFLTFRPTPHLNGKHTVFGRVISGFDVLEKIQRRDPEKPNPPVPDKIVKAEVLRKRNHEYAPHKVGE